MGGVQHLGFDPVQDRVDAGVRRVARGAADGEHSVHMRDRGVEIAEFRPRLLGSDLDEVVVLQQFRLGFDLARLFVLALPQQCLPVGGRPLGFNSGGRKDCHRAETANGFNASADCPPLSAPIRPKLPPKVRPWQRRYP